MFSEEPEGLKKKIKALIAFRVIFITLFFAITFFFWGFRKFPYHNQFLYLIIGVYAATIVYSILYGKIKNLKYFAYAQLVIDIIFETILIYFTGGIESWYSFTLIITILASSIVIDKKAGFVIATQSSIFYGNILVALICIPFISSIETLATSDLWMVSFLGIFQIAIAYAFFASGLKRIQAVEASIISMVEPVLNPVWVLIGYGEVPSFTAIIGGLIILGAIIVRSLIAGGIRLRKKFIS